MNSKRDSRGKLRGASLLSDHAWLEIGRTLGITKRELQIVQSVFDNQHETEIGKRLKISHHTVHMHICPLSRATKVQGTIDLHAYVMRELRENRLFDGKDTDLKQPPLFQNQIKQNANTTRGADPEANLTTFRQKYGPNYEEFYGLTKEILEKCNPPKN